jgi:uncharacterized protein YjeT (DUF2065 family)
MDVIVYLLGFGHIAASVCLILYTKESIDWLKDLFSTHRLKYLSAFPALVGLLFLISASATVYPWVFLIIGLLAMGEAVVAFTNPHNIYRRMLDWYFGSVSDQTNRLFGIIGVVFGTAILTWIT